MLERTRRLLAPTVGWMKSSPVHAVNESNTGPSLARSSVRVGGLCTNNGSLSGAEPPSPFRSPGHWDWQPHGMALVVYGFSEIVSSNGCRSEGTV